MTLAKLLKKTVLVGPILGAMIGGAVLLGCASGSNDGSGAEPAVTRQEASERADDRSRGEHERNQEQGRESGGEHGSRGDSGGEGSQHNETRERGQHSEVRERGGEAGDSGSESGQHNEARERSGESGDSDRGEASSANALARDATFDEVRGGARLVLKFDDESNSFRGTVENTGDRVLTRVRVEVHLDNGAELGPTTPTDLAPGETLDIVLPSTAESFTLWTTHAEVGSGEGGSEHGGESGESGGEGGDESREAEMSSPITPLDERWSGVLGGIAVDASFDQATGTMHTTVRNTTGETLCFVQSEPHLKSGANTVGELGPDVIGDLAPGQEVTTSISVASEPGLAGVSFDGYVVHLEVFECGGPGPQPHSGEGGESGEAREGRESSRGHESAEQHGDNGESGGEHGSGGEGGGHE
ncbi:MAG: hypothetical protein F4038_03545 [Chloroflexi bacterium]|nr:hypothetical protein [Chloroflexota bacterium]MYG90357.1 hypothetical protein [Chloroflexota bacterium]MYJ92112.1 hypothetical protein [Chloroflexota bacterium]